LYKITCWGIIVNEQVIKVLRLEIFSRRVKKLFTENEIDELAAYLAQNPEKGDVISGMNGLRKLRWSLGNQGERGGSRVIYYYHGQENLILLLSAYAKNQQEDMDSTEKKILKEVIEKYFVE